MMWRMAQHLCSVQCIGIAGRRRLEEEEESVMRAAADGL